MSQQVRDVLKKTKGVIIITIALHVLLPSWYISRHGRLVQISNNQADPRGERFLNDLHLKCASSDVFVLTCGENVASKLFLFPSIYRHKLVPSVFICSNPGITTLPRPHLSTQTCFASYRGKNFACCFLVQSRPNTIANQQRIVIWYYEGRWNATCHDLSCLEAGHRPL